MATSSAFSGASIGRPLPAEKGHMRPSNTLSVTRRFAALCFLGLLGAVLFLPSIVASANPRPSSNQLLIFVASVAAVVTCSAWFGLRCADAVALPMPYLRRLDHDFEPHGREGLVPASVFGILFGLVSIAVLRTLHLPNLAGPLWSRIASVFFAAGSLEIVVHLFIMSLVIRITRGLRWTGIVVAAIFFILFHASGLPGQSFTVVTSSLLMNGTFGLGLGVIYARYGFEYLLLCHAIGHVLAVVFA
jgi:hypothetical protein